jgi:mannose-6-phosphate isomerase-like protein (cupin superfamily)
MIMGQRAGIPRDGAPVFTVRGEFHVEPKGWGREIWIENNEDYCGKILEMSAGKSCSWHYHLLKDEVIYVDSGEIVFTFSWGDDIGSADSRTMKAGDSVRVRPNLRHKMSAVQDARLLEFSTHHIDTDSIRVIKGD